MSLTNSLIIATGYTTKCATYNFFRFDSFLKKRKQNDTAHNGRNKKSNQKSLSNL